MRVSLTVSGKDDGGKSTVDGAKASVDGLSASLDKNAASAGKAKGANDALTASMAQGVAAANAYDEALASRAATLGQVAQKQTAFDTALRAGVINVDEYAAANAKLEQQATKLFSAFQRATPELKGLGDAAKGASLNVAGLQREAAILGGELARGNTAAFEKSLVTLARQSGILQMAFSGIGAAVAGSVLVIGGAIALYEKGAGELEGYNKALALTGNYANTSADALAAQAGEVGKATGNYTAASQALTLLAASGKVTGGNLAEVAQGVVSFADLTGSSIESAVKEFEKLGDDPYQASVKLTQSLHYLSVAQADELNQLEQMGDKAEAAALAEADFAAAMIDRDKAYKQSLTGIAQLWDGIKTAIDGAVHSTGVFLNQQVSQAEKAPGSAVLSLLSTIGLGGIAGGFLGGAGQTHAKNFDGVSAGVTNSDQVNKDAANEASAAMQKEIDTLKKLTDAHDQTKVAATEQSIQERLLKANSDVEADSILRQGDVELALAAKYDAATAAKKDHGQATKSLNQVESELNNTIARSLEQTDALTAATSAQGVAQNKYDDTLGELGAGLDALNSEQALGLISGEKYNQLFTEFANRAAAAGDAYDTTIAKAKALAEVQQETGDAVDRLNKSWADEIAGLQGDNDARDLANAKLKAEKEVRDAVNEAIKEGDPDRAKELQQLLAGADAFAELTIQAKKTAEAGKEWQSIWVSAADSFSQGISNAAVEAVAKFQSIGDVFKSVGQVLADTAKSTVAAIINYFLKLAVINPILNAIFGGSPGFSSLATLGGNALGDAAIGTSDGAGGGGNSLIGAGVNIGGGIATKAGFNYLTTGSVFGGGAAAGGAAGQSLYGSVFGTGEFDSGIGSSLADGGGYLSYGGGVGGALGTAGGIAGGYYLGQKYLGGTAGGIAGAAGIGAASYFVPIIGWIAGAITLIDTLTHGSLLGTDANKFKFGQTAFNIDNSGSTVTAGADFTGRKSLFGGSYHEWKSFDPDPAAVQAAQDFFDALKEGNAQFAKDLGTKAGEIASGTFEQNFDKDGNPTTTSTTIAGHTYTGETGDQFQEREVAETQVNDLSAFDKTLSADIDKYRGNADQFAAIVNALGAAQLEFNKGSTLLALGTDQSISHLLAFAAANAKFGESVDQTIARIEQAQGAYDQFVGQFKPAATYADAFQESLANIADAYKANTAQANALAVAAGAAGASQEDLTNIQKTAAAQLAQAVTALRASNQSEAIDLGYTTQGESPDQIDQEISQIQQSASANVRGFGNAMQEASQQAVNAMNLLLGDLSPLTDQAKLQAALAGLKAGTSTAEQVLTIGRRLYASSQAYTDLYNQVKPYAGGKPTATGTGGGQLNASDQARIAALQAQKVEATSAQRHQEAVQLAQGIAELSTVTGESYADIAKEEGFSLDKLMKDLGVSSMDQLTTMLDGFKNAADSSHEDSQDLLDAILQLPRALGEVINGTGDGTINVGGGHSTHGTSSGNGHSSHPTPGGSGRLGGPNRAGGHSGHGTGADMARGFISVINRANTASARRGGRTPFQAPVR